MAKCRLPASPKRVVRFVANNYYCPPLCRPILVCCFVCAFSHGTNSQFISNAVAPNIGAGTTFWQQEGRGRGGGGGGGGGGSGNISTYI